MSDKIIFSDLDNTLIHSDINIDGDFFEIEYGIDKKKFIHKETIFLINEIRLKNVKFALITGRRLSNFLPAANIIPHDLAIIEHGGIILNSELGYSQDIVWSKIHSSETKKILFEFKEELINKGFEINDYGRDLSFRVVSYEKSSLKGKDWDSIDDLIAIRKSHIQSIINENCIDIIPTTSGKLNAIIYLMKKEHINKNNIYVIGDDYNDLDMISFFSKSFCPNNSAIKIKKTVTCNHGYVSPFNGARGINDILSKILKSI